MELNWNGILLFFLIIIILDTSMKHEIQYPVTIVELNKKILFVQQNPIKNKLNFSN